MANIHYSTQGDQSFVTSSPAHEAQGRTVDQSLTRRWLRRLGGVRRWRLGWLGEGEHPPSEVPGHHTELIIGLLQLRIQPQRCLLGRSRLGTRTETVRRAVWNTTVSQQWGLTTCTGVVDKDPHDESAGGREVEKPDEETKNLAHLAELSPELRVLGQAERTGILAVCVALETVLMEGVRAEEVHRRQLQWLTAGGTAGPLEHHRADGQGRSYHRGGGTLVRKYK